MSFDSPCKISYLTLSAVFFILSAVYGQEPDVFMGRVNADKINIRSDATISSKIICSVNRDDTLEVVQERYNWYKIRLPRNAPAYIRKDLVECISMGPESCRTAKIIKNRINIRLGPEETSPILGAVNKNEIINITRDAGNWYKIEPIANSFGWIHSKFVERMSEVPAAIVEPDKEKVEEPAPVVAPEEGQIIVIGTIKPRGMIFGRVATHKLITPDNKTYLLKGNKKSLDALNNSNVKVTGKIISSTKAKIPIIEVKILEVIN